MSFECSLKILIFNFDHEFQSFILILNVCFKFSFWIWILNYDLEIPFLIWISNFDFKFQLQISILSLYFEFQFQISMSSLNFKFKLCISNIFQFMVTDKWQWILEYPSVSFWLSRCSHLDIHHETVEFLFPINLYMIILQYHIFLLNFNF